MGTEHILLALFDVPDGLAMRVLDEVGVSKHMVEEQVLALIKRASASEGGRLPFTPRAKSALSESVAVALELGHNYIGTEHLLLGLFADEQFRWRPKFSSKLVPVRPSCEIEPSSCWLGTARIDQLGAVGFERKRESQYAGTVTPMCR